MIDGLSIDQVPVSWRYAPLGSFCEFSGGTQPPKSTFKDVPHDGYVRLLQIRDFETDNYAVYIPANKKLRIIEESDVSIARYGASVGRILTGKSGAINVAIMTTYPDTSQVWKGFLFYALQHPDFQTYLTGLGGRAAQAGFNKGEISRFKFPLPPLPEQRKIAGVLGVVQRAIEQQERLLALTAELKKVLLHQLFTAGLRGEPQKKTEIGPMPESWEINTVADVAHVKGGKRLPKGDKFADKPTPFPYIRVTDLREFGVDTSDLRYLRADTQVSIKRYTISKEDVYISIAGSIGITGMIPTELEGANLTENAAKMVLKTKSVSPRFLMYFLGSPGAQEAIRAQTVKNAQPKLALARIASLLLPVPSHAEQVEITAALDAVSAKEHMHRRKQAVLAALFRTLLHQLMTAQLRVHDLDLGFLECGDRSLHSEDATCRVAPIKVRTCPQT